MLERGFLISRVFLLFFSEFSCPGRLWTEFETKIIFMSCSAYLIPFWLKIMPGKVFEFFCYFFSVFSCRGRVWTEIGTKIIFSLSAYLIRFWLKIMLERGFLIFKIFLLFFSEFSCPCRVWTELQTKIFCSTFLAYLIPFWQKKKMPRKVF